MKILYFIGLSTLFNSASSLVALDSLVTKDNKFEAQLPYEVELSSQNKESFNYTSIAAGLPIPLPGVIFGHREKQKNSAVDISLGLSTIVIASGASLNLQYLKYINDNNYYFGGGGNAWAGFVTIIPVSFGVSPTICFGKEKEKAFHQLNFNPIHYSTEGVSLFPTITYQYGFKY